MPTGGRRWLAWLSLCTAAAIAVLGLTATAVAVDPNYVRIVGNQSSREGVKPKLIVLHTTTDPKSGKSVVVRNKPGLKDLKKLGAWFDDPAHAVSSHVANDAEGNDARYVKDRRKAWTVVDFNSVSLNIEQIGSSSSDRDRWLENRAAQLESTARWIAYWHRRWHIPIRKAEVSGDSVVKSGVTTHAALGYAGGGHHDPGPGYPFVHVLRLARDYAARN
jgi:N-acetyl-anhydromuramyl-L-alanine amidase AmpD